jgi:hypothetical protein
MILETEVCDSNSNIELKVNEDSTAYDQSFSSIGSRPSVSKLEEIFKNQNIKFERFIGTECNSTVHKYDWTTKNSNTWAHGLRAMWFLKIE